MNVHPFLDTLKRAFKLGEGNILMGGGASAADTEQDSYQDYADLPPQNAPAAAQNYQAAQYTAAYPQQQYPQAQYTQQQYPQQQYAQQAQYAQPQYAQLQYVQPQYEWQQPQYPQQQQYPQQYAQQAQYAQPQYAQPQYAPPQQAEEEQQPQGGFRSQFTMQQEQQAEEAQQAERRIFGRRSARHEEAQQAPAAQQADPAAFAGAVPPPAPSQDIYIVHVAAMEDCRRAMTALRKGNNVLIALDQIDSPADSRRMLDTLMGAAYALDSCLVRVSNKWNMFIMTPAGVTVHTSNNAVPAQSAPQIPYYAGQDAAQPPYYPAQDAAQGGYRPSDISYSYPAV